MIAIAPLLWTHCTFSCVQVGVVSKIMFHAVESPCSKFTYASYELYPVDSI